MAHNLEYIKFKATALMLILKLINLVIGRIYAKKNQRQVRKKEYNR